MGEIHVIVPEEKPFYTVKTLARRLALSERQVRNLLNSGKIPSYTIERSRRIDPDDVDSYLASRREERTAA